MTGVYITAFLGVEGQSCCHSEALFLKIGTTWLTSEQAKGEHWISAESVSPLPARGFQIPLPEHVISQIPSDPTQSRAEPCRRSQEHSYYKLPRSTKGDMIRMCPG